MRTRHMRGFTVAELMIVLAILFIAIGAGAAGCNGCVAPRVARNAKAYCQQYAQRAGISNATCECMGVDGYGNRRDGYVTCTIFAPPAQPSQVECRANAFVEWDTGCRLNPFGYRRGQYDVNTDGE